MPEVVNANPIQKAYSIIAANSAVSSENPKECVMRKIIKNTLIDLGNAVAQTKGLAQQGTPDTFQGQKYPIPGLTKD